MSIKTCNSSLDTVIILEEATEIKDGSCSHIGETEKKKKRKHSRNRRKCANKKLRKGQELSRNNIITEANVKCSEKHISQEIHVEKKYFRYIINLKTTVCDHKDVERTPNTDSGRNKQGTSRDEHNKKDCKYHIDSRRDKHNTSNVEHKHKNLSNHTDCHREQNTSTVDCNKNCTTLTESQKNKRNSSMVEHKVNDCTNRAVSRRDKQNTSSGSNQSKVNEKDRKVPECFRSCCISSSPSYNERKRDIFNKKNVYNHPYRYQKRDHNPHKNDKKEDQRKPKHIRHKITHLAKGEHGNKQNHTRTMSSISLSPLKGDLDNISYDDISITSLDNYIPEIPTSYTRMKHKTVKCKHKDKVKYWEKFRESKLDTLIRRTKERERLLVEQSRCTQPLYTSTPIHNDFSSDNVALSTSDMDISLTSTLVLDTYSNIAYSPSCSIDYRRLESEIYTHRAYSPSSPIRDENYTMKEPKDFDNLLINIKNEPMMDIEAYSPIRSPDINETVQIQDPNLNGTEVAFKIEPQSAGELSPTYDNSNTKQFDIVKTEFGRALHKHQSSDTNSNRGFPTLLRSEYNTMKDPTNNYDYKHLNIKNASMTDLELQKNTGEASQKFTPNVKTEALETTPVFPAELSPIYSETSNVFLFDVTKVKCEAVDD